MGPGPPGAPGRLDPGRDGRRAGRQPPPPPSLKGTPPSLSPNSSLGRQEGSRIRLRKDFLVEGTEGQHPDLGEVGEKSSKTRLSLTSRSVGKAGWGRRCCMPQHVLFKSFKPHCEGLHRLKTAAQRQLT